MAGSTGAGLARVDMRSKLSTVAGERIRTYRLIQYIVQCADEDDVWKLPANSRQKSPRRCTRGLDGFLEDRMAGGALSRVGEFDKFIGGAGTRYAVYSTGGASPCELSETLTVRRCYQGVCEA